MSDLQAQIITNQGQSLAVLQGIENRMKAIQIATAKANAAAKDYQRTISGTDLKKAGEIVGRGTGAGGQAAGNIFKGAAEGGILGKAAIALVGITASLAAINRANEVALGIAEERLSIEKRISDVNKEIGRTKDSIAGKGESAAGNRRKLLGAGGQDALDEASDLSGELGDPSGVEAGVITAFNKTRSKAEARAVLDVARRVAKGGGDFGGAVDDAVKYPVGLGNGADQGRLADMIFKKQTGGDLTKALRNVQGDATLETMEDVNGTRVKTRQAQVDRFTSRGRDMANREYGENADPENTARQKLIEEIDAEIERKKKLGDAENGVVAALADLAAALGLSAGSIRRQAGTTQGIAVDAGVAAPAAPSPRKEPGRIRMNVSGGMPGGLVEYQP